MRYKSLVRAVQNWVSGRVPAYVFKETIYPNLWWVNYIANCQWRLEVINLSLADFNESTRKIILDREFGDSVSEGVRDDMARTQYQLAIAKDESPGCNEPILIIQGHDGFDLVEGWHRTMTRLPRDGVSKVPLKAWVGVHPDGQKGYR
jgi:hypothetical protein